MYRILSQNMFLLVEPKMLVRLQLPYPTPPNSFSLKKGPETFPILFHHRCYLSVELLHKPLLVLYPQDI